MKVVREFVNLNSGSEDFSVHANESAAVIVLRTVVVECFVSSNIWGHTFLFEFRFQE